MIDASCQCGLLTGAIMYNAEEVRNVGCQSQVTYKRKILQPRIVPVPFNEGCFPEPTMTRRTNLDVG